MKINLNCFALIDSMITIVVKQTVSYVTHKVIHYYYIDLKVHSKNSMLHFNNSMLHSSYIQKIDETAYNYWKDKPTREVIRYCYDVTSEDNFEFFPLNTIEEFRALKPDIPADAHMMPGEWNTGTSPSSKPSICVVIMI